MVGRRFACVFSCTLGLVACGSDKEPTSSVALGSAGMMSAPTSGAGTAGASGIPGDGSPGVGGTGLMLEPPADAPEKGGARPPLMGVTATESGGYKLGDKLGMPGAGGSGGGPNVEVSGDDGCGVLVGVVRDFRSKDPNRHPDFEVFSGSVISKGLVAPELDADHKPVYASACEELPDRTACPSGQQTTSKANFDQWYRNTPDVNQAFLLYIKMDPTGVGNVVSFRSENFVPLDGMGWDDMFLGLDNKQHNYAFTTELHIKFKYSGGESFTFKGDDDVWAFINGKLAMDLGGLHNALEDSIALDDHAKELGLVKGNVYPLELFHAERHSSGSHFRMDSTLSVVDCGSIPEVPR